MKQRINIFDQLSDFYEFVWNHQKKVKQSHISLYMFLLQQNNRNGWVEWFSLAIDTGMTGSCIGSKTTYYKCLTDLSDWGLIKYEKGSNAWSKANVSILIKQSRNEPLSVPLCEPLTVPQTEPLLDTLLGTYKDLITLNIKLIKDNLEKWVNDALQSSSDDTVEKESKHVTISGIEMTIEEAFDLFWNTYDLKIDRKNCEKLFMKIKRSELQKLFDSLPLYFKYISFKNISKKHPKTWLNGECWNDVYEINGQKIESTVDEPEMSEAKKRGKELGLNVLDPGELERKEREYMEKHGIKR